MFKRIKEMLMNFWNNNQAQITIGGLLAFFVLLVVAISFLPIIDGLIVNATSGPNQTITGPTEITLLRLIPPMIVISIIAGLFSYMHSPYG